MTTTRNGLPSMPAQAGEGGNILGITLSRVMASPPSPEAFLSLWRNSLGIFAHFYGPTIRTVVADPTNPVNQWLVDTYAHCLATIYKDGPHQDPALAKDFTTWRDQQALQLLLPQAALGALHASEAAPLPTHPSRRPASLMLPRCPLDLPVRPAPQPVLTPREEGAPRRLLPRPRPTRPPHRALRSPLHAMSSSAGSRSPTSSVKPSSATPPSRPAL